jgi:hypothetical protein
MPPPMAAPDAKRRSVVINLIGKFPLGQKADVFPETARAATEGAGFRLQFGLIHPNGADRYSR